MKKVFGGVCSVMVAGACCCAVAAGEVAVKTAAPELVSESEGDVFVGRVEGSHAVDLTARVVGTLWERNGEEGQTVKKGDVLFIASRTRCTRRIS